MNNLINVGPCPMVSQVTVTTQFFNSTLQTVLSQGHKLNCLNATQFGVGKEAGMG
jgi:hypothetical protein